MEIRTAKPSDLDSLAAVEALCFPPAEAASRSDLQARLAVYSNHFWLLSHGGRLISFVNGMVSNEPHLRDEIYQNAALHREDGLWQMIFGVNTIPEFRRQGCARLLLQRAISDARTQGRAGLVLTCKPALIHYYASLGFVAEGVSESVHGGAVWHQMRLRFQPYAP